MNIHFYTLNKVKQDTNTITALLSINNWRLVMQKKKKRKKKENYSKKIPKKNPNRKLHVK